jgi:hypothetical protein
MLEIYHIMSRPPPEEEEQHHQTNDTKPKEGQKIDFDKEPKPASNDCKC